MKENSPIGENKRILYNANPRSVFFISWPKKGTLLKSQNRPSHEDETLPQINWDLVEQEATLLLEEHLLEVEKVNQLIQNFTRTAHQGLSLLQYALKNRVIEPDQFVRLHKMATSTERPQKSGNWSCIREKNQPPVFETAVETIGHYKIISTLGRGGMGVVYKALDSRLNRIVALKMLREENLENTKSINRFLQEGKSAAKLSHPRIVSVYELGEISGIYYIAMKYIEGDTLDKHLKKRQISTRNKVQILLEISEALEYAHQNKIIHRDLKPSNIIIDTEGHPNIMDFGLAKDLTSETKLTRSGEFMGTPRYMSPEQVQAKKNLTPQLDQFSLGVIFYEILTGKIPFHGTQIQVFNQILKKDPPPPSHYVKTLPKELNWICLKLLEKEPEDRYHSISDLIQDLQIFLAGGEVKVSRIHRVSSQLRKFRKKRLGALGALVGILIFSLFFWKYLEKQRHLKQVLDTQKKQEDQVSAFKKQKEKETRQKIDALFLKILENEGLLPPEVRTEIQTFSEEEMLFFLPYLEDERSLARQGVILAFDANRWSGAIPSLKKLLVETQREEEQILLLKTLRTLKTPFTLQELQPHLESESYKRKFYALHCLEFTPFSKENVSLLQAFFQKYLAQKDYFLCSLFLPYFGLSSSSEIQEILIQTAKHENAFLRETSLKALEVQKYPHLQSLFDPEEKMSSICLWQIHWLETHPSEAGIASLRSFLTNSHLKIALAAVEALQKLPFAVTEKEKIQQEREQLSKKMRSLSLYRSQAKHYFDLKNYSEALPLLNKVLEISPDEESLQMRGESYLELGKANESAEDFLALIQRENNPSHYVALAKAVTRVGLQPQAIQCLDKALSWDPENLEALEDKGLALLMSQKVDEAIETLESALKLNKNLVSGYQLLGQAYCFKQWYQKAISTYQKALELDPNNFGVLLTLGNVYLQQNLILEARNCFEQSLQINPTNASAYYFIGETYFRENNEAQAMNAFTKSLECDADNLNALIRVAEIEWKRGQRDEAHTYLDTALKRSRGAYASGLKAKWLMEDKAYATALEYLQQVTEENSDFPEHYTESLYLRAKCHFAQEQYQEAFEFLKQSKNKGYPVLLQEWNTFQQKAGQ